MSPGESCTDMFGVCVLLDSRAYYGDESYVDEEYTLAANFSAFGYVIVSTYTYPVSGVYFSCSISGVTSKPDLPLILMDPLSYGNLYLLYSRGSSTTLLEITDTVFTRI